MIPKNVNKCPVLSGINKDELFAVFQKIHFNIKSYEKDILILGAGELCENLMILIEGSARGEMTDFEGNTVKVEDIRAPKPIAPAFIFGNKNICPVNIIANEDLSIIFIPREEILKMMQINKQILTNYLNIISNRTQFLSQKVRLLSLKSLKKKIAYYYYSKPADVKITQQSLADVLGVTRPALARALGKMEQEGILSFKKGKFQVLDSMKLREILQ